MERLVTLRALQDNYIYVLIRDKKAIIIDPSEFEPVEEFLQKEGVIPVAILNTHHHYDHVGGNLALKNKYDLKVYCSSVDRDRIVGNPIGLVPNQFLELLDFNIQIMFVPGHTDGQINFYFKNQNWLFTGDTLFVSGCGRLFEGTHEQLLKSLKKMSELPDETKIYPGHEYSIKNTRYALSFNPTNVALRKKHERAVALNGITDATLGGEKATNPFLMCHSQEGRSVLGFKDNVSELEAFTYLRKKRDSF